MISPHPAEDVLEACTMGKLAKREIVEVEAHLLWCQSCQSAAQETELFVIATRAAARTMQHEHRTLGTIA